MIGELALFVNIILLLNLIKKGILKKGVQNMEKKFAVPVIY